jgi:hypothetical protein
MFGRLLCSALAPRTKDDALDKSKFRFAKVLAALVAHPGKFGERVLQWDVDHPDAKYSPITNDESSSEFKCEDAKKANENYSMDSLIDLLVQNRVPSSWIDHAYMWGVAFIDAHHDGSVIQGSVWDSIDNERHDRLEKYGEPPAIPHWTGWWMPSREDRMRLSVLQAIEEKKKECPLNDGYYLLVGQDPSPRYLRARPMDVVASRPREVAQRDTSGDVDMQPQHEVESST